MLSIVEYSGDRSKVHQRISSLRCTSAQDLQSRMQSAQKTWSFILVGFLLIMAGKKPAQAAEPFTV
jgi:hypothetical protein